LHVGLTWLSVIIKTVLIGNLFFMKYTCRWCKKPSKTLECQKCGKVCAVSYKNYAEKYTVELIYQEFSDKSTILWKHLMDTEKEMLKILVNIGAIRIFKRLKMGKRGKMGLAPHHIRKEDHPIWQEIWWNIVNKFGK